MDGQVVFKNAVKTMSSHCATLLKRNDMTIDDVDWFIPHQANLRIAQFVQKTLQLPDDKVYNNIQKYGNTSLLREIPINLINRLFVITFILKFSFFSISLWSYNSINSNGRVFQISNTYY